MANLVGRIPSGFVLFCAVLSLVIPYVMYRVNRRIHQLGDPPWMKQEERESRAEEKGRQE
ncbi:hypothetical protein ACP26L_13435 [Paenibacillus sp. S-38]|uniref:hypothetical protein n=1 Tax=Paenibacillus sp. S-38 TaxID=3416710 RepID=UPI003CE6C6A0